MLAMSRAVEVRRLSGDKWCSIIATENMRGQDLKLVIARKLKICECRLDLIAGKYTVVSLIFCMPFHEVRMPVDLLPQT